MVTYLTSISDEWGVFLIRPVLFCVVTEFLWVWHTPCCLYVGIFCCIHISHAVFVGSFFYASCYFMRGVSLIHPMLFLCRVPCSLLGHDMCCFMLGISLICTMLLCMGSFLYMPVLFIYLFGDFLWHALCWGVSVGVEGIWGSHACPIMQFYIGSFSYAPHAFNAGNFACTPCAASCGEFLSHTLCSFAWGVVAVVTLWSGTMTD